MTAQDFRTAKETKLFWISAIISGLAWTALIVTIIGLAYGLLIGFFLFAAHSLMIAYIKGHGVRLSQQQFPQIYDRVVVASEKLGLPKTPEVYLMQAGGALNAFATKWSGRNFVVIYTDLLEACGDEGKEIDMIVGHEIGHLALGHLKWLWFLIPSRMIPLLGAAYSRACEYSCDQCGFAVVGDLDSATRGLTVLAAGGNYGKKLHLPSFVEQTWDTGGFWASVYELNATHPYLSKRVAALINKEQPGHVKAVPRSFLAYPLAPLFGMATPAGSAPLMMVAVMGIVAAVAIPQFQEYQNKADAAAMEKVLTQVKDSARVYQRNVGKWPCTEAAVVNDDLEGFLKQKHWQLKTNCTDNYAIITYQAQGENRYRLMSYESGEMREGSVD